MVLCHPGVAASPRRRAASGQKRFPAICRAPPTPAPRPVPTVRACSSHSAATPRPQQLPHISHPQRTPPPTPPTPGTAAAGFGSPAIVLLKNPRLEELRLCYFWVSLGFSSLWDFSQGNVSLSVDAASYER